MLISEKKKLIKELESELSDIKIERKNTKESPYLIDYLYGVSDVKESIEDLLLTIRDEEWILFYQVLLNKKVLESKKYYRYSLDHTLYFIMKNEEDLKKFKELCTRERETSVSTYKEKLEKIYSGYEKGFKENSDKKKFKALLENYFSCVDLPKKDNEYIKATGDLGEFLKICKRKGKSEFKQAEFFKKELGFKNNNEYPEIAKKYKKVKKSER